MAKRIRQQRNTRKKKAKTSPSGSNLRIYHCKDENDKWCSWEDLSVSKKEGKKKAVDSIVHRFHRIIGFSRGNEEILQNNHYLMEVRERVKTLLGIQNPN